MSCTPLLSGLGYYLLACGDYNSNCRSILSTGTHSLIWCNQTVTTTTSVAPDRLETTSEATKVVSTTSLPLTTTTEIPYERTQTPYLRRYKYVLNSTNITLTNVSLPENTTNQSTFKRDTTEFIPLDPPIFPGFWIALGIVIFLIILAYIKYRPKWEPCKILPETAPKVSNTTITNQRGPSGQIIQYPKRNSWTPRGTPRRSKGRKPVTFKNLPVKEPPIPKRPVPAAPVKQAETAPPIPKRPNLVQNPQKGPVQNVPVFTVDDLSKGTTQDGLQLFKTLREHKKQMHKK